VLVGATVVVVVGATVVLLVGTKNEPGSPFSAAAAGGALTTGAAVVVVVAGCVGRVRYLSLACGVRMTSATREDTGPYLANRPLAASSV